MIEIPGYKIHREIDSSDYCQSFSAIQLSTGKTMVVSVFSHSATDYESFKSFFDTIERKLANKIFGVITPIKEFIKTQRHTYIISDLLSNNCQQIYKSKEVDINTIFQQIYKVALSLNLYHQVGFYHGGVAIDNLFHDNNNNLTLGLAAFNQNFSTQGHETDSDLHKESYKAPEKEVSQSKSRDFYALGVVLYELIFKQKPFLAHTKEQLEQLKHAAVIVIPDHNFEHLKPIFSALLNSNPINRIASANDFQDLVQSAGIPLSNIDFAIEPLETEHVSSTNNSKPTSNKTTQAEQQQTFPKYVYYLAGVIIVASLSFVVLNTSQNDDIDFANIIETPLTEETSNYSIASINSSDESDFDVLIDEAKTSLLNQEIASSLMAINHALKIKPNDPNALTIKQQIEGELKIKAIIQQASTQILSGNIISPPNDNAINTYNKLQLILPKGDSRAQDGINKISNAYHRLALKQYKLKNTELAKSILAEGLTALPNAKLLKQLAASFKKDDVIAQNKLNAERQKQQALQIQKSLAAEEKESIRRVVILERNKQRELEIKQQKQTIKDFQIQKEKQRRQQLTSLFNEAQSALTDNKLTLNSIAKATDNLQSLEFLSVSPNRSRQLRLGIDKAYLSLSKYYFSIKQYGQAESTIIKGLSINSKHVALNDLRKEINSTIEKQNALALLEAQRQKELTAAKQEEKALPIFGTF